jgi:hypothetical protein
MAVTAQRITVSTTAVALNAVGTAGMPLTIRDGATAIDLGPSGVTTGAGFSLPAAGTVAVEVDAGDVLYGITGAGTSFVEVLQT